MAHQRDLLAPPEGRSPDWAALRAAFAWLRALDDCPQDPQHHGEGDVGIHTRMVADALLEHQDWDRLSQRERWIAWLGVLLHDVAKPATTRVTPEGRITQPGHSRVGAVMTRGLLWRLGVPHDIREAVCGLIAVHQVPFFLVEKSHAEARRRVLASSLTTSNRLLAMVAEADARGRVCDDQQSIVDNVHLFRLVCEEEGVLDQPFAFASDYVRWRYFRADPEHAPAPDQPLHDPTWGEVVVMSGLPGAGKSTWIAASAGERPVVSLDAIRGRLKIAPEDNQGAVVHAAKEEAKTHLRAKRPFIWDATNLTRQMRDLCIAPIGEYGAKPRIVYVETDTKSLFSGNKDRDARVPEAVIDRLVSKWEMPDATEAPGLEVVLRGAARLDPAPDAPVP